MMKNLFLFTASFFLASFALAQSQMIKGTIVPAKKKSVLILPVAEKKDTITKTIKTTNPSTVVSPKINNGPSLLIALDTTVLKNYDSTIIPVKTNLKAQYLSGEMIPKPGVQNVIKPLPEDLVKTKPVYAPLPSQDIKKMAIIPPVKQSVGSGDPINNYSLPPGFVIAKGSDAPKRVSSDPVSQYSLPPGIMNEKEPDISVPGLPSRQIKSPLDVLDTTPKVVVEGDAISKYSLPQQLQPKLKAQTVTGILEAKPGAATTIVPVSAEPIITDDYLLFPPQRDTLPGLESNSATGKPFAYKSPLDALDTSRMVYDASSLITSYTTPDQANYKSQLITKGILVPANGFPIIVEPISTDSLLRRQADTVKMEAPDIENTGNDSLKNVTVILLNNNRSDANNSTDAVADAATKLNVDAPYSTNPTVAAEINVKPSFYVAQNGKFSVRFTTDKFYLNISQLGKMIDYEILSNGKITSNAKSKVVQVGNIKVSYNLDGSVASIAEVPIAYTYDGRVNRVGDVNINYTNSGAIDKVGNVPVFYNGNSSVEKIATYRVGYNDKKMVIGIDDSNGLVVFKP